MDILPDMSDGLGNILRLETPGLVQNAEGILVIRIGKSQKSFEGKQFIAFITAEAIRTTVVPTGNCYIAIVRVYTLFRSGVSYLQAPP